ncbi:MAG: glycoside hydrolase family 2 TIM barrel-domain containing protein [Planctomycetota bacterium]|nr:glycoside hydrolase family 2 TIM barrel-domain containing protein [Planctomycetota bacterium]
MRNISRTMPVIAVILSIVVCGAWSDLSRAQDIPLPEHPRPDFERPLWINLNGPWQFRFDKEDAGLAGNWASGKTEFPLSINVPFPWGSELSGVEDQADIAWYKRTIRVPADWKGSRVFVVVGACDWLTTGWLDGQKVGSFQGGYTPFEFELTDHIKWDRDQTLALRVDDTPHPFKLEGKQGYGPAKGIWQTIYLEARPKVALETVHFLPDIDAGKVTVKATLNQAAPDAMRLAIQFKPEDRAGGAAQATVAKGRQEIEFDVPIKPMRLWSLEDPYLYEVKAVLSGQGAEDVVSTYFGMRKISVVNLPGTDLPYIALNNKPVYLKLSLDQAYHPEGFYTFPSNAFMRDEILRSRQIGLNGQRIHVKIGIPRKLYWADKLGILIMADVPNSWGRPNAEMRSETEVALRGMIRRDFNHPCVFSWVVFNETWGLRTGDQGYTPQTQEWVASMVRLARQLDATRLVEDNSPCNHDHVLTDINTWHAYLPGYKWTEHLAQVTRDTYEGSTWNYIGGRKQGTEPLLNSECGNVWGYEGSTGDVDWSWDYHLMMDAFRRHPKVCGWLYTEHHDVINEWNGYWRFDRSEKFTGMEELMPGMSLRDLHGDFYIALSEELCQDVKPGASVEVPLYVSFLTDAQAGENLTLRASLRGWDSLGRERSFGRIQRRTIPYRAWHCGAIEPLEVTMPNEPAVAVLAVQIEDRTGVVLARNFTTFAVRDGAQPRQETLTQRNRTMKVVRFAPKSFVKAEWPVKQWNVFDGLKVNGAGAGYFEYRIPWPHDLDVESVETASFRAEIAAKQLFGKDKAGAGKQEGDYMRGRGTHDPSLNPNAYPMTDEAVYPSAIRIRIAGEAIATIDLPDDPADHRGILSWQAQKRDGKLNEAGSYGYLVTAQIPESVLRKAAREGTIAIRLEADEAVAGGIAIYGERFGRYPLDPTLAFILK